MKTEFDEVESSGSDIELDVPKKNDIEKKFRNII